MSKKKVADLLQEQQGDGWFQDTIVAHAPTIMGIFANLVVIFMDYRAYDVMMQLTGVQWKALSASLACAVPFVLWEIAWQYNHTTDRWRVTSLAMAGLAFATSIFLGVADFLGFDGVWADWLLGGVVITTGIHTVVGFLYYYNDPDVARKRHKAQAMAAMLDQEENAMVTGQLLKSGSDLLAIINQMEAQYDPDDVEMVMNIIQGKKKSKPTERRSKGGGGMPQNAPQRDSARVPDEIRPAPSQETNYTLADYLSKAGMTKEQAAIKFGGKRYADFAADCNPRFSHISGSNMRAIFAELVPNPTQPVTDNGRR